MKMAMAEERQVGQVKSSVELDPELIAVFKHSWQKT